MRKPIFILILLTICVSVRSQRPVEAIPVRIVFTVDYQKDLLGYNPIWRNWPDGSLSRALTYIRAHRRESTPERFALVNAGTKLSTAYQLYSNNLLSDISEYAGYETAPFFQRENLSFHIICIDGENVTNEVEADADFRIAIFTDPETNLETIARHSGFDLAVSAFGREPQLFRMINSLGDTITVVNTSTSGRYLAVADFVSSGNFTAKFVDISGFQTDAEYEERFQPLADSLRIFYDTPIATLPETLSQDGFLFGQTSYMSLFHRFQLQTTGAAVSFFAPPLTDDSIPAGDLTFGDLVRRFRYDNKLCVIRLTQAEIRDYLEYSYGLRYNTMRRSSDDLVRMTRDRDGILHTRTAVYNLDEAGGIRYEVDVSKPAGRRIRILSFSDGFPISSGEMIPVALNSHRIESGYLARACGLTPEQIAERLIPENDTGYSPENHPLKTDYQYHSMDYRLLLREWMLRSPAPLRTENNSHWKAIPESFLEAAKQRFYFFN